MKMRSMVAFTRDSARAGRFWNEGMGLPILRQEQGIFTELALQDGVSLALKETYDESKLSCGYSPVLMFDVKDIGTLVPKLVELGATLDGAIQYPEEVGDTTLATLRAPDCGIMLCLEEPNLVDIEKTAKTDDERRRERVAAAEARREMIVDRFQG